MKTAVVVSVAVDRTVFHYDKPFDYLLPEDMHSAQAGCRVMVPFGKGNRKRQGIILSKNLSSEFEKLKPVVALLDAEPVLSEEMLKLAEWIKEHTFCTYYDAVKLMLPAGVNMQIVESYKAAEGIEADTLPDTLSDAQRQVMTYLISSRATVEKSRLLDVCGLEADSKLPDELVALGLAERKDDAVRRMGDATVRMVRLSEDFEDSVKLTSKQRAVTELLGEVGSATVKEICYFTGVTQAVINGLEKKELVECFDCEVYRTGYNGAEVKEEITLTDEQAEALNGIMDIYRDNKGGAALLYGITGSGKTQVFLKAVDQAVADSKGVIVMVPEISLTPQMLDLFNKRYGGKVAVFHSAMSMGQRMDEWKRVKNKDALVAIGTRSAVFAPFDDIGLIIIDEEQEHTYKSETTPKFNAKDVARFRCSYHNAMLLLASATPSVETYAATQSGRFKLLKLTKRYGNAVLPKVHTVDMRKELSEGNASSFSRFLQMRIGENLEAGRQTILLLNRRGHNTIVTCSACSHIMTCPNCSISLTYHSANNRLMCHSCGYSVGFANKCSECGCEHIKYSGVGTQRAEQELKELFPDARVLRMDADSNVARNSYSEKLEAFAKGEYDIMLGTQMVAKGLNFPNVTLVGVLNADATLFNEDYRNYERTFSLLTQVIGRSGRGDDEGIAVIQTMSPENETIELACEQNYEKFYEQEILSRKVMIYPPYCSLCLVGFVSIDANSAKQGAARFLQVLKQLNDVEYPDIHMIVLGPSAAVIPKVSGKYRYRILIKVKNNRNFRQMLSKALRTFFKDASNRNITAFADINPESTF